MNATRTHYPVIFTAAECRAVVLALGGVLDDPEDARAALPNAARRAAALRGYRKLRAARQEEVIRGPLSTNPHKGTARKGKGR